MTSPLDHGGQSEDLAYVGRLPYHDRTLLIIAGMHALGSLGAVDYLTSHAAEVCAAAGTVLAALRAAPPPERHTP